jgi:hypothetical protein
MKSIVLIFLAMIVYQLGRALFSLVHNTDGSSTTTLKSLTWRINLSIGLFALLFVAFALGWLQPHGL